ncbi:hypothetical protein [Pseudomonas aeruginosa]
MIKISRPTPTATQTMSDIEAKIGSRAKAGQIIGNFNNLFMLRVRETATAELLP